MKIKGVTVALAVGAGALIPGGLAASSVCADEGDHAVLVVDTGTRDFSLCVELDEPVVSGIELIQLAADQYRLQYQLGYGGRAVCQLDNVPEGNPPDDCFKQGEPFWGYWRGGESGDWTWSGTGAASTEVSDGDIEGWAFDTGNSGESHDAPPMVTFDSVCNDHLAADKTGGGEGATPSGDDDPTPEAAGEPQPEDSAGGRAEDSERDSNDATEPVVPRGRQRLDSAPIPSEFEGPVAQLAPTPTSTRSLPAGATSPGAEPREFPAAGALAIAATVAMAALAAYLLTRRKAT